MTYKVDLDIYNGPMDLLLYLIRREEVDIKDVSIARITDQYIAYLDLLKGLDIELAGDFVVMAATLLELKSRSLLPRPPEEIEEPGEEADEEDPRETLIRQLLDYRRFKEAAAMLDDRGREMARRFPRQFDEDLLKPLEEESDAAPAADFLQGIQIWDLIGAFSQVVRTLGYTKPREVVYDDTPIEEAGKTLLRRLEAEPAVLFTDLFEKGRSLPYCITMFLAILELVRQRKVGFEQESDFRSLRIFARDPSKEPPPEQVTPKGAAASEDALQRKHPRRPTARQRESVNEMMVDEVDFEKTEYDEILESVRIPDVEAFKPIYSDGELMGKAAADAVGDVPMEPAGDAAMEPAGDATPEAPAEADADDDDAPPADEPETTDNAE